MKRKWINGFEPHKPTLQAWTLNELILVLIVVGILAALFLPKGQVVVGKARAVEAKLQLGALYNLQNAHFLEFAKYSDNIEEIGFEQGELVTEGGRANYIIEITEATNSSFKATAVAVTDFDQDGIFNVWEVDEKNNLQEKIKD